LVTISNHNNLSEPPDHCTTKALISLPNLNLQPFSTLLRTSNRQKSWGDKYWPYCGCPTPVSVWNTTHNLDSADYKGTTMSCNVWHPLLACKDTSFWWQYKSLAVFDIGTLHRQCLYSLNTGIKGCLNGFWTRNTGVYTHVTSFLCSNVPTLPHSSWSKLHDHICLATFTTSIAKWFQWKNLNTSNINLVLYPVCFLHT
jgi:hypothetical protein